MLAPSLDPAPWQVDTRATYFHRARVVRTEAGHQWGIAVEDRPGPGFHAVLEGEVWINMPRSGPRRLGVGDALWMPAGQGHFLGSHADGPVGRCDAAAARRSAETGSAMRVGFGPVRSRLVSIMYEADRISTCPSLRAFAEPVLLQANDAAARIALLGILDTERANRQLGSDAAADMVAELLLIDLHRTVRTGECSTSRHDDGTQLDDVTRDSHALIHQHPELPWTSDSLAAAVRVSRATLHRHFARSLGISPMTYLTRWRMQCAVRLLLETDEPIQHIALTVGYASPNSFGRAFHRTYGASPRQYRDTIRPSPAPTTPFAESVPRTNVEESLECRRTVI